MPIIGKSFAHLLRSAIVNHAGVVILRILEGAMLSIRYAKK